MQKEMIAAIDQMKSNVLAIATNTNIRLSRENKKKQKELKRVKAANSELHAANKKLRDDNLALGRTVVIQKKERQERENTRWPTYADHAKIKTANKKLEAEVKELTVLNNKKQREINDLKTSLEEAGNAARAARKELKGEIARLKAENEKLRSVSSQDWAAVDARKKQLEAARAAKAAAEKEVARQNMACIGLKDLNNKKQREINDLKTSLEGTRAARKDARRVIAELKVKNKGLWAANVKLEAAKTDAEDGKWAAEKELARVKDQPTHATSVAEAAEQELAKLKTANESLRAKADILQTRIDKLARVRHGHGEDGKTTPSSLEVAVGVAGAVDECREGEINVEEFMDKVMIILRRRPAVKPASKAVAFIP